MIIFRYISRQLLATTAGISLVLLFVFIMQRFARYLADAAVGKLPAEWVLTLLMLRIPSFLGVLIPLSFFLGMLWVYSRLYADHEMTVLKACGVSEERLLKITLVPACLMMTVALAFTLWIGPQSVAEEQIKKQQIRSPQQEVKAMSSGRFQEINQGKQVIYVESMDRAQRNMHNIFIASLEGEQKLGVMSASEAAVEKDPHNQNDYIVFRNGYRYTGDPSKQEYSMTQYQRYLVRIQTPLSDASPKKRSSQPTLTLWKSVDPEDIAELQWRLAIPLSLPIFAVVALPLTRTLPRQGRYTKLLPAMVLFIVFVNLLTLAKAWVENGDVPTWFGLWWVLILYLSIGFGLLKWRGSP